ncbi:MAG: arginase family protein [Acidobacteriota bacterium]|nr:arginase family protein [Acidobacteriota bacterium]
MERAPGARGADQGPAALLEASGAIETWDIETGWEPHSVGFTTRPPIPCDTDPETLADRVEAEVSAIFEEDRFPVVIGGEHSVSIGAIRAAARRFEGLNVLQIDAHADTREEYEGSRFNHACVMARARQWCPISQVGLRSVDVSELAGLDPRRVWYAHEILERPRESWIPAVVDSPR